MNSSSILGCQIRVSLICASVVLFFYIRIVVWESFLLRFSFYSRSFGLVLYCMYPIVISLILIICFAISCLCLCHSAVFLLSMLSCVLLRCISMLACVLMRVLCWVHIIIYIYILYTICLRNDLNKLFNYN